MEPWARNLRSRRNIYINIFRNLLSYVLTQLTLDKYLRTLGGEEKNEKATVEPP